MRKTHEQCPALVGSCQCRLIKDHLEQRHETVLVSGMEFTWKKQRRSYEAKKDEHSRSESPS